MKTDYTVDTVGKFCPVPIIEASNRLKEMSVGETLTVISDDEGIKNDMPNWCAITGNKFLGMTEEDGEIKVFVKKAAR